MNILPISDGNGRLADDAFAQLVSVMLFPKEPENRKSFQQKISSGEINSSIFAGSLDMCSITDDDSLFTITMFEWCYLNILHDLDQVAKAMQLGQCAANIVMIYFWCARHRPEFATVNRAIDFLQEKQPLGTAHFEKAWSRYKSVSHLWLAYLMKVSDLRSKANWRHLPRFPFLNNELDVFLGRAKAILRRGCDIYPPLGRANRPSKKRRQAPLFPCDEMWEMPNDLALELDELEFGNLDDESRSIFESYAVRNRVKKKGERST